MYRGIRTRKQYDYVEGNANYHKELEVGITLEDLEMMRRDGVYTLKEKHLSDGGKEVVVYGVGEFKNSIYYHLHISPSGRVFLEAMHYRLTRKIDAIRVIISKLESEIRRQKFINVKNRETAVDDVKLLAGSRVTDLMNKAD